MKPFNIVMKLRVVVFVLALCVLVTSVAGAADYSRYNMRVGAKYLAENAKKEGVTVLKSGVQYTVLKAGEGTRKPGRESRVTVVGSARVHTTADILPCCAISACRLVAMRTVTSPHASVSHLHCCTHIQHYAGRLLNGKEFDSSIARGEPAQFGVTQVIGGWTEVLQLMVRARARCCHVVN
jgi:hypothetical protein